MGRPVIGETLNHALRVIRVGAGDVQVNLKWNKKVDVDLSLVDPQGEKVWYRNKEVASGGGRGNENVYWPDMGAPSGSYKISIKLFSSCGAKDPVNYRVYVVTDRTKVQKFEGTLNPVGDVGREKLITTITR